ncbi:MAG: hypothetical protein IPM14_05270 [bacterium]|nr:hypothetical protein [bacterium]
MRSNLEKRLEKLEKAIVKILNPNYDKGELIVVLPDHGETLEQKIAERERELGHRINRNKVLYVSIEGITKF